MAEINQDELKKSKFNAKVEKDRDKELVKGIFRFHETPGGTLSFVYKKYKGDGVEKYDLVDGEMYTLPRGVAKHLNNNLWYPIHKHSVDSKGKPIEVISQKVRRCTFQSMDFMDIDDASPVGDIVTVTPVGR